MGTWQIELHWSFCPAGHLELGSQQYAILMFVGHFAGPKWFVVSALIWLKDSSSKSVKQELFLPPLADEEKFMGFHELAQDHTDDIAAVTLVLSHLSMPVRHQWPSLLMGFMCSKTLLFLLNGRGVSWWESQCHSFSWFSLPLWR